MSDITGNAFTIHAAEKLEKAITDQRDWLKVVVK